MRGPSGPRAPGLYERNPDVVASDPKYARETDLADARELAGKILAAITSGQTPEACLWSGKLARVWTHLDTTYREIATTGRWLLRADPNGASRLPAHRPPRRGEATPDGAELGSAPTPPAKDGGAGGKGGPGNG